MSFLNLEIREPTENDLEVSESKSIIKEESLSIPLKTLTNEENEEILQKVEKLPDEQLGTEFFKRETTLTVPIKGDTVKVDFPSPEMITPKPPESVIKEKEENKKKLKVIRYSPEGKISVASHVLVTFNQSIVPLSSIDDIAEINKELPIEISPKIEGEWRWIGTQTIKFKPKYRIPKATEYVVTVGKELISQTGKKLEKDFSFKFLLPTVEPSIVFPSQTKYYRFSSQIGLNPVVFVEFNQKIDPKVVFPKISVDKCDLVLFTNEDAEKHIESDEELKLKRPSIYNQYRFFLENGKKDHILWFGFKNELESGKIYVIKFEKGIKSAEGPIVQEKNFSHYFNTYDKFKISNWYPDTKKYAPLPMTSMYIHTNNNIELESFNAEEIFEVEPPIEDAKFVPMKSSIKIDGKTLARATYKIKVKPKFKDVFGQTLEKEYECTFYVGSCEQTLQTFQNNSTVIYDATLKKDPCFDIVSVNIKDLHIQVYQIEPHEICLLPFSRKFQHICGYGDLKMNKLEERMLVGKKVFDEIVPTESKKDEIHEFNFNIVEYLQNKEEKLGIVVVLAEPVKGSWKGNYKDRPILIQCIQSTKMALDMITTIGGEVIMLSSDISTGIMNKNAKFTVQYFPTCVKIDNNVITKKEDVLKVTREIQVEFNSFKTEISTDENGLGIGKDLKNRGDHTSIICRNGKDVCVLPNVSFFRYLEDQVKWYVVNDRNLYKPKEKICIKGILRELSFFERKKVLNYPKIEKLIYHAVDSRGNVFLKEQSVELTKFGSFSISIDLPDNINLGTCYVKFKREGNDWEHNHSFKVEEFRVPKFKSSLTIPKKDYFPNGITVAKVKAEYYSGGGLAGSDGNWDCRQEFSEFIPPHFTFKGFKFTIDEGDLPKIETEKKSINGKTDVNGEHQVAIDFRQMKSMIDLYHPVRVHVDCNVMDLDRQTISSNDSFLVHPSNFYVGLKAERRYCKAGDVLPVSVIVSDTCGRVKTKVPVVISIKKREYEFECYRWKRKEKEYGKCTLESRTEPVKVDFKIKEGGTYVIYAKVFDEDGRANSSSIVMYVQGGFQSGKSGSNIEMEELEIIANKKEYKIGEEAKILITTPLLVPQNLLCLCTANGIRKIVQMTLEKENNCILSIPIIPEYVPSFNVVVYATGTSKRIKENGIEDEINKIRPGYAMNSLSISVPEIKKKLTVIVDPAKKILLPGEESKISVKIMNSKKDTTSRVSCVIVDEAVLSLTGYTIPDPINTFCIPNCKNTSTFYSRGNIAKKLWSNIHLRREYKPNFLETALENTIGLFSSLCPIRGKCRSCFDKRIEEESCCCCNECCSSFPAGCFKKKKQSFGFCSAGKKRERVFRGGIVTEKSGEGKKKNEVEKVLVRSIFKSLVLFKCDIETDADGSVKIPFKVPDNLTKYRIWCIAENDTDRFGIGESFIQTQMPVTVRPSLPRFLNFYDTSNFSIVCVNQSKEDVELKIATRIQNLNYGDEEIKGYKFILPSLKRKEVQIPVKANINCGNAKFQVVAIAPGTSFSDSVISEVPIYTPCTSEAFATYGTVSEEKEIVVQNIVPPSAAIFNQFGGLKITFSSTALQSLTDSFLYVYNYQYDCLEQIGSRVISIVALSKFLEEFNVPNIPKKSDQMKVLEWCVKKIENSQKIDGSFGFFSFLSASNVYLSLFMAHTIARMIEFGYGDKIPSAVIKRSVSFCKFVQNFLPFWYSKSTKANLNAFAVYVMALFSIHSNHVLPRTLKEKAEKTYSNYKNILNLEGLAWVMFGLYVSRGMKSDHKYIKEIMNNLKNKVNETAETANFVTSYGDDGTYVMLHSNRRTDAIILEVLCHISPEDPLLVKIAKGILKGKKKGRWNNTQECVYILLAMKKYFEVFEKDVPNFKANVWVGEDYGGELGFKGRETEFKEIDVPMKHFVSDEECKVERNREKKRIIVQKEGKGRLYYRMGLEYARRDFDIKQKDYGFIVMKKYESADISDKESVKFDNEKKSWLFKAGALVRVKIKLINTSVRYYVALVDYLPSGCEVLNTSLKGTQNVQSDENTNDKWWNKTWYEHQNLRTERVEAFSSRLWCGEHEYSFVMRATTKSICFIPPCKAVEMYSPEVFGCYKSEKVEII